MGEYVLVEKTLVVELAIANIAFEIDRGQMHPHVPLELGPIRERVAAVLTREQRPVMTLLTQHGRLL